MLKTPVDICETVLFLMILALMGCHNGPNDDNRLEKLTAF